MVTNPFREGGNRYTVGWIVLGYGILLVVAGPIRFPVNTVDGALTTSLHITLLELPALGVVYGGYWLHHSDFDPARQRRVLDWCGWGTLALVAFAAGAFLRDAWIGAPVRNFEFVLLVATSTGASIGLVLGIKDQHTKRYAERIETQSERVEAQREALFFLNRFLRHHVLNGMNIIHGYAGRVESRLDDGLADDMAAIQSQCDRIVDLIDNVRVLGEAFARYDDAQPVDLSQTLHSEVEKARGSYPSAVFETDVPPGLEVETTPLLSAAIENLLRNAVEHNDSNPPCVEVTAEVSDGATTVRIADNGPGIPDDRTDRAFDPGEWGESGVGLFLADTLISNYGGEIRLENAVPQGTVVVVELPRAVALRAEWGVETP